ncbi:hypothetical protein EDB85DRAFT_2158623 [Lactarius pseudohatsudake]|nr:hypothetical protein EDB85DRAFT_2158623 [Lactarius pseudohatsudake]
MSSTSTPSAAGPSTSTALSAPSSTTWVIDSSHYSALRDKKFYIGNVLISTESLKVDLSLQRPLDPEHAKELMPMYSNEVDFRTHNPLDCVVDIGDKDKVDQWVKEQDPSKLSTSFLKDMLVLDLSNTSYLIVKGQHRYEAYCQVMKEDNLPQDSPHPGCLAVKLYHSDPKDTNHHRLFALAVHDNLPTVKKDADAHSLCQCVMRTSWAEISGALSQFHNLDFHNLLGRTIRAELYFIFQVSQTPKAQLSNKGGTSDRRLVNTWAACKMFLDHTLLEALIELNDNSFGPNFSITVASLEGLFHKVEWLPFLAVLFRDIFEVVKDFKTSEGVGLSKGLLNDLSRAYSSKRLDVKKWPKVDSEAWLLKAKQFQEHWFDFKHLSYNALIGTKKDFIIAADCFRMLAVLLSDGAVWNRATTLDNDLKQDNALKGTPCCYTFVHWKSCPEGVLRNYIYNKFVGPCVFEDNTHYCLIKDDKGVVQGKVFEVVSFLWSQRFTLKLPSRCTQDEHYQPFCLKGVVGLTLSAAHSISPEPVNKFMDFLSKAVSSCAQWRHLLRVILDCSSPLPCGIVADLEKPKTPTPPPRRASSPLSSCPSSPRHQTSPFPSTSRQKAATPEPPSSPGPSPTTSPATSRKKGRLYVGQLQHNTSASSKVAPQQKERAQRKRRVTPIYSSDELDELAKENKAPESEPEPESPQSDKEGDKSDKSEEEESEPGDKEGEEGEKASCQPKDMEEEEEEEEEKEKEEAQQKEQVDEEGDKEPEGEKEKEDASEDGGADEGGEKSKGKEEVQVAQQKEQVDKEGDKEPEGEKEKEVASEDGGADEGGEKSKGKEEVQVAQPKEQVGEEEDTEPEGEKEKENASEDGGTDEGGEKGKGKEVAAPAHMDEDEEEHAGGEEAEKVAHSQKDMSQGEGVKEGQEKEVTKKRQASTEEGSSKRAKFDPPAPSTQQPTQGSYAGEATQEPIYSIDELKKANSPFCLPYMDWAMPEEEIRKYLISFINDKRIPAQTLFNLFQASIKLYNVGGGSREKGIWDYDPDTPREQITIKHTFNDTDMTFDPDEIDGRISATYPGEEEDVEMED